MSEAPDKITFSFGENWKQFVASHLDAEREQIALNSVKEFLGVEDLKGLTFLDVGCGSGLFSLAAHRLGAKRIVSVDVDPRSVEATQRLREAAGAPESWRVVHGSILDKAFVSTLESAEIVYAWGSLHHTGHMWDAIRNAAGLVTDGGLFFLGIYNRTTGRGSSEHWLRVKKRYNRRSGSGKRLMEYAYILRHHVLPEVIRLRSPFAFNRNYKHRRGMNAVVDVRDWLGGYPYEFAGADEIFRFCNRELHCSLVNLRTVNDTGVNEFLFRKRPA
jgi:SAM-dependent methyltransferase